MAAHPFGPIENQLIVGYYKRGWQFRCERIQPKLTHFKTVLVPDETTDPLAGLLQPVFYGWSPANGNSSSHDFRVTFDRKSLPDVNLLSRGLGYRITFTMPEQGIARQKASSWPKVEFHILDFLGTQTVGEVRFDQQDWKPLWLSSISKSRLKHLSTYTSLQVEVTNLEIRIVENGDTVTRIPTFCSESSPGFKEYTEVLQKHRVFLGDCINFDDSNRLERFEVVMEKLNGLARYLQQHHKNLQLLEKSQLSEYLKHFSLIWFDFCLQIAKSSNDITLFDKLDDVFDRMQRVIQRWLQDEGQFPKDFSPDCLTDIWENLKLKFVGSQGRLRNEAISALNKLISQDEGVFWYLDQRSVSPFLSELVQNSSTLRQLNQESNPVSRVFTQNFIVLRGYPLRYHPTYGVPSNSIEIVKPDPDYLGDFLQGFTIVPDTDTLLFYPSTFPHDVFHLLDLRKCSQAIVGVGSDTGYSLLPRLATDQHGTFDISTHVSWKALCVVGTWNQHPLSVAYLSLRPKSSVAQNEWAILELKPLVDANYKDWAAYAGSITKSKYSRLVFVSSIISDYTVDEDLRWPGGFNQYLLVATCSYGQDSKTLSIGVHKCFQIEEVKSSDHSFWVEAKHGLMFACVFRESDARLQAVYHYRRVFAPLGSQHPNQNMASLVDLSRFGEQLLSMHSEGSVVGVLSQSSKRKQRLGFDTFQFARLYFKV